MAQPISPENYVNAEQDDDEDIEVGLTKLTEWVNEPKLDDLKADLEATIPTHDAYVNKVKHWNSLIKVQRLPKKKGRSSVAPRIIRRQNEWRYSALSEPFLSAENLFDVKPVTFEDHEAAIQNATVLNWQFRTKMNKVRFIDQYIRTSVDDGSAIVRLGWNRVAVMEDVEVPVWEYQQPQSQQEVDLLQQAIEYKQMNPRGYEEEVPEEIKASVSYFEEMGIPSVAFLVGSTVQRVEQIIDNRPTVMIMNPENVFIDPSCGPNIEDAMFVVASFETSQADMLKAGIYKNLNKVDWMGASIPLETKHGTKTPSDFNFKDPLRRRVVAYEYWGYADIHGTGELVSIVATWIGNTLVRMEENPFPDGKPPFVVVNYLPVKQEMMGEPDAELLEDNQAVIGAVMRGIIDLMGRSANSQQGMAKGMLDALNLKRFREGENYEFNPNVDPKVGLIQHTYPEIPQSALAVVALQNQEAEALTGVKSFSGGMSGEAYGDVAAGIRGVLDAASKREMAILRRLAQGLEEIGRKIISMNQVFLSEEEVVRVTNEKFETIRREDLAGDFDLIVDISTPEIDNNKAQDLGFMLQTIGPNLDFSVTKIILVEIARLKKMPFLAKTLENFQPQPDPIEVEKRQLENEKLRFEVEKLRSEATLNAAKKVATLADAAATDLETNEQASGIKHARAMEQTAGQAEANQNLEVTKSLLKPRKVDEKAPDIEAAVGWGELSKMKSGNPSNLSMVNRNMAAKIDPRLSIHSKYYDPALDPSNPNNRI